MADENNSGGGSSEKKPSQSVEVIVGADRVSSATLTRDPQKAAGDGTVKTETSRADAGLMLDIGDEGVQRKGLAARKGGNEDATEEQAEGDTAAEEEADSSEESPDEEGEDTEGAEPAAEEDGKGLGDYNAEDPEVVEKFDKRYWSEDGSTLNLAAFNPELEANLAAGKADISKGAREYLKDKLGLSDDAINQHIAGVVLTRDRQDAEFYSMTGGKEAYEAMVEWGKGAYTETQKARFRDAMKSGDPEVIQEQVDLLKNRFTAAGQVAPKAPGAAAPATNAKGPPSKRRPVSPAKSASAQAAPASAAGPKPFEDNTEYRVALKEAGSDEKKQRDVRKRLEASPKLWRA